MQVVQANNNRIAKNTLFLTIRMIFVMLISLYTSRVILNTLGVTDFGVYNVVGGFVAMFGFMNQSLANGIQRFYNYTLGSEGEESVCKVYSTALLIQTVFSILIILVIEPIGVWYINNKMVLPPERLDVALWLFQFSVVSLLLTIIQTPFSAAIMAYEKMDYYALVSIVFTVLKLLIVFLLQVFSVDKLLLFGALTLLLSVGNFLMYYCYCKIKIKSIAFKRGINRDLLKRMLSFSGWNVFGVFGGMMREQGLNMILNLFFGPIVNASRGVAVQVSSAVQGFVSNMSVSVQPQITQAYAHGDKERSFRLMHSYSKIGFVVLYMFSLPIIIDIKYILHLWLGDAVPLYTASLIPIVFLISYVNTFNSGVSALIHSSGNMKVYQLTGTFFSLIILPVAYICLKFGGNPQSAFWISFAFTALGQVASLIILKRQEGFSLKLYLMRVIIPLLVVVVTTFFLPCIPYKLMSESLLRLVVICMTSIIPIAISFYFLGTDQLEKLLIKSLAQKVFVKFKK